MTASTSVDPALPTISYHILHHTLTSLFPRPSLLYILLFLPGMVLAVCMMQALDQEESLKAWISSLQEENPQLAHINVIFNHQPHCENSEREGQIEN
mgnify:CR=1 FL=1